MKNVDADKMRKLWNNIPGLTSALRCAYMALAAPTDAKLLKAKREIEEQLDILKGYDAK